MAVHVHIEDIRNGIVRPHAPDLHDRQRRLHLTARRRRLARIRKTATTAAWIVGSGLLAMIAIGGPTGLR